MVYQSRRCLENVNETSPGVKRISLLIRTIGPDQFILFPISIYGSDGLLAKIPKKSLFLFIVTRPTTCTTN